MNPEHKWYVQFSVKDPKSGRMVRKKLYSGFAKLKHRHERYALANKLIQEYTDKLTAGWNPLIDDKKALYTDQLQYKNAAKIFLEKKLGNSTLNFHINQFLKTIAGLNPNTVSTYTSKLRVFQMWCNKEGMAESDITAFDNKLIKAFFTYLNNERQSSKITYNKYKQILFALFEQVADEGKIVVNPVQRLPKCTRVVDREPKPINDEDVKVFMDRIKNNRQMFLFVLFEYYCLMRPGEIRLMKISWIDFGRKIINIPKEINKTKRPKTPIVPTEFMKILRDDYQLHLYNKDFYVIGKDNGEPGPVHLGKNTIRTRFNVIRKELKMPVDYMLYSWKHTANVRLERENVSNYDRMMQNGHTSIVTTEKYTRNKTGFRSDTLENNYPSVLPAGL
jgi:integrase